MTADDQWLRQLEKDFNNKDPIDIMTYKGLIDSIVVMGFSVADAIEAALVCNTTDNLETITDYLLDSDASKQKRYRKRKKEMTEKQKRIDEMNRYMRELEQEKQKQIKLEEEWSQLMKYREKNGIDNSARLCVNCTKENKVMCVFPCMHVCLCENCTPEVEANGKDDGPGSRCPVCSEKIAKIVRVYNGY